MTVKTDISRFDIHDELTAPEGSARLLAGCQSAGGSVSKFVGVLAGAPAALRAFARMRHELRGGALPQAHPGADRARGRRAPRRRLLGRPAREDGARRRPRPRRDLARPQLRPRAIPREAALLAFLRGARSTTDGRPASTSLEEAREVGLDRRGAARGGRARGAERVPEPDRERRGAAAGPVGPERSCRTPPSRAEPSSALAALGELGGADVAGATRSRAPRPSPG